MVREIAFDDVFDSQASFRALLDAMSRPGILFQVPRLSYRARPPGFCPPALSILKTLCDHKVSFSLGGAIETAEWVQYLEVNTASPFQAVDKADYVLFDGSVFDGDFARLRKGTPEFPERSATAVLSVRHLSEDSMDGAACSMVMTGPGVKTRASVAAAGLDPRYVMERGKANRLYPLGIDLILVDGEGRVAGIPRTSTVEIA